MDKLQDRRHPLDKQGVWSFLNFNWVKYYLDGTKGGVVFEQNMHPDLPGENEPAPNYARISQMFNKQGRGIFGSVVRAYGARFVLLLIYTIVKLISIGLNTVTLYLISKELENQITAHGRIKEWVYLMQLLAL